MTIDWKEYFSRAEAAGVRTDGLPQTTAERSGHVGEDSGDSRRFLKYIDRLMKLSDFPRKDSDSALAFFDSLGRLIRLYGSAGPASGLVREGVVWSLNDTGPNAVTVGLSENTEAESCGDENYNTALRSCAIYFSPVSIIPLHPGEAGEERAYGGVAAIVPMARRSSDYSSAVAVIAHDLTMNLHFTQTANMLYERTEMALLTVDTVMEEDSVTATYANRQLFDILEAEPMDIMFKPASLLIDPLPENRDFWSIIHTQRQVNNYRIDITARGKKTACIISTDAMYQPLLNVRCVIIYLTTSRKISAQMSEKMGNNAVVSFHDMIGESEALRGAISTGIKISQANSNVLLLGESGVGKDLFAQSIHNSGPRRGKPFIAVNCGALPRDLIASELFGYSGGAFTGAKSGGNVGKFELANGGTLFLDEIAEMPIDLQAMLLRVVEQKRFTRLGSSRVIEADVRIISATNADIPTLIAEKRFRADLFYRLSTMEIQVPPLRERGEDVLLLAAHFGRRISSRLSRRGVTLSASAERLMLSYEWPGNVRELQNLMERLVQLYPGTEIDAQTLEKHLLPRSGPPAHRVAGAKLPPERESAAPRRYTDLTMEELREAMKKCGGNKSEAARYLGMSRRTFYRKLEALGL